MNFNRFIWEVLSFQIIILFSFCFLKIFLERFIQVHQLLAYHWLIWSYFKLYFSSVFHFSSRCYFLSVFQFFQDPSNLYKTIFEKSLIDVGFWIMLTNCLSWLLLISFSWLPLQPCSILFRVVVSQESVVQTFHLFIL